MRHALAVVVLSLVLATPAAASGILELRIQLPSTVTGLRAGPTRRAIALRDRQTRAGSMRRERRPELGPDRLVIVVTGRDGAELDWRTIADPRVVRIETADANGLLSGQRIIDESMEFTLRIPDLPGAARVVIYSTEMSDRGYTLALIGEIGLAQ